MHKEISNVPVDIVDEGIALKIKAIFNEKFSISLKDIPLFIFRRRLALAFKYHNISIKECIENDNWLSYEMADQMLCAFFPDHSEIFRDFETWLILRDRLLNSFSKKKTINILFPHSLTGEEIYSIIILFNEFYPQIDYKIKVTSPSAWALHRISNGYLVKPKSRLSLSNYKLLCEKNDLNEYLEKTSNTYCFKRDLLNKVEFIKQNDENCMNDEFFDLIICRNKTLSFNAEEAILFLKRNLEKINKGGLIVFGINENIPENILMNFQAISWSEKIFQKKAHE